LEAFEQFYDEQDYMLGGGLERFENAYAQFNETKFAIGVGNGHDALLIILKSLGIGAGDEVILPAHTFIATALSVANSGAKPVLADIDEQTFCIDPDCVHDKISSRTKAIIPVHLYGNPAKLDDLMAISDKKGIHLIEDNAQSQGATFKKKKTGSFGVMNFTSFYPTKNIGALGDGGMITTNDPELAEKARSMRDYGKDCNNEYNLMGMNSRLDELQARLLNVKLRYLDKWNQQRIDIGSWYSEFLGNIHEIQIQKCLPESMNVPHIYPIITEKRDEMKVYLKNSGIDTIIHYPKPIHLHKSFSFLGHKPGEFPKAEMICKKELSLPIYPGLTKDDVQYVCTIIKGFFYK
jgi:dTDP-4-amino-4,6-dideoxygalactose transaminase